MEIAIINETVSSYAYRMINYAGNICSNKFSENIIYLFRYINPNECNNWSDDLHLYLKTTNYSLNEISELIYKKQNNTQWVDLHLLFSEDSKTFILVTLVSYEDKSNLNNELKFHAEVPLPYGFIEGQGKKFDINKVKHIG